LFVDVRGFTSLAEKLPPAEVANRLNRFYSLASNTIFDYDGTLDKLLVADQVMAFFGAPLYTKDHPERAVQAALQIINGMSGLAQLSICTWGRESLLARLSSAMLAKAR